MTKVRIATVWLAGCSGCHMSFLDLDEWLLDLAERVEVFYSPIADIKEFPHGVDVTLVEGAVANTDNLELLEAVRERTRLLVSFGDCAGHGNVTDPERGVVPALLPRVLAINEVVKVDAFLPGCPPSADRIRTALEAILDGQRPELAPSARRFG